MIFENVGLVFIVNATYLVNNVTQRFIEIKILKSL